MQISRLVVNAAVVAILLVSGDAYSTEVDDRLDDLNKRLNRMEVSREQEDSNVHLHGSVEVEYGYSEDYSGVDSSDIVLATLELAVEVNVNENVDAQLTFLYEEDDTPLEVDAGVIYLHNENSPFSLALGQIYVPFGKFHTNMVSDPLTLELGETRESAAHVVFESTNFCGGLYVFNGDIEEGADEDKANKLGVNLCFKSEVVNFGIDYISSISDTDSMQDFLPGPTVVEQVAGVSVHTALTMGSFLAIVEYLGAMDSYDVTDMAFNGVGAEPSAMYVEFVTTFLADGRDSSLALGFQSTDESVGLGLPESRTMITYSSQLYDSTALAFEYLRDQDYSLADGGTDETSFTFTVQLHASF